MSKYIQSRKVKNGLLIVSFIWWSFWFMLQFVALQRLAVPPAKAFIDAAASIGLLAFFSSLVLRNMRYYLPRKERYLYVVIISGALSALWLIILKFILESLYRYSSLSAVFSQTSMLRYSFSFLILGCMTLVGLLWYTEVEQREENDRKAAMERLATDAELNKLRQQLQPHFLFNSLNSISALTGSQPEKARHMIQQLADFLRGTLKNEEQRWTSFEEELQYVQLYLDIEKVRFGYRLHTSIEYDKALLPMKLPSLLLQPLVENAIKFGLYDTIGEVVIHITAVVADAALEVTIRNPYDETTAIPAKGTGFGLSSTRRRLFLLFGRQDLMDIHKASGEFTTKIRIPQ